MDSYCPCSPLSGLTVTAGGGLATRAVCQIELGEILERLADLGGEGFLNFPPFMDHREPRRELRG